jgi:dihydroflavonol-4-reductase
VTLDPGDRVLVTGAAGFIGSAVTRALLGRGAAVVAGIEPGGSVANLAGLDVDQVTVDIRDPVAVDRAVAGCRAVFHVAALYGFWPRDAKVFYEVNVEGTRNVLAAAGRHGCERVVYTSSVATLGIEQTRSGKPSHEGSPAVVDHLFGAYKQSKYVAEHEALRAAAEGLPLTLVLPTYPLGPRDSRPTPTGKLVLDFLNGRMPAFVDTAMNVAHVDDLAEGHVLALERGAQGRSYIVGGENLSMAELLALLADRTGLPAPRRRVPGALALGAAYVSDTVQGRLLGKEPSVPLEGARMAATHMIYDDSRARTELGYTSRPPGRAVEDSARWFVDHGYVSAARLPRITLAPPAPASP